MNSPRDATQVWSNVDYAIEFGVPRLNRNIAN